jgi:periplasmic protein TonB
VAESAAFKAPGESDGKRWLTYAAGALLIFGMLWFVYRQLTVPVTIKAKDERTITAAPDLLPPPPPPPPPPPEPQEKPPEPTETPARCPCANADGCSPFSRQ